RCLQASLDRFFSHSDTHRQCIDEQSHHAVRSLPSAHPSEQHRPEHHVLSSRQSRQHLSPCQVKHTGRRHSQLSRSLSQPFPQPPRLSSTPPAPARALLPTPRSSATRRADRSPPASLPDASPAVPGSRIETHSLSDTDPLLPPSSDETAFLLAKAPVDICPAH